jgi:aspartyl-tRNA(Asn)/glutamyl-tRNA(Gln) amidotransferase subunit B
MGSAASASPAASTATDFEAVIGIEIHVQLRTASKMFCACANDAADASPNARTCPVCLGLPGALPVLNREAVRHVLATGLAIEATIPPSTRWDRKSYFYPDLPKGYQISQYDLPLASAGRLRVDTSHGEVEVGITRAHLEEDTARLVHTRLDGRPVSLLDFDRSGAPLLEIVSEPVIHDAETARRYAEELRLLLVTIGASQAAMESGQMRVEANVSLRPRGTEPFGTRVEVKNMNSFRSVERAIDFEIARQAAALRDGTPLIQETRGWDDDRGLTYHMRSKESSEDYRYFPEPDLPPLRLDPAWLEEIRRSLPELPADRRRRYRNELGLSAYDAAVIVSDAAASLAFEDALAADPGLPPKKLANWVTGEVLRLVRADQGTLTDLPPRSPVDGAQLAALVRLVEGGKLSGGNAKEVLAQHAATGRPVADLVREGGLQRISDLGVLHDAVAQVIAENPAAVADIRAGTDKAIGFLVGQVMKRTRGQADAATVQVLLREALAEDAS